MSSLNKILKEWNSSRDDEKIEKASCVRNWLNSQNGVDGEFANNLQTDCALPHQAANALAELLATTDNEQLSDPFNEWADSFRLSGTKYTYSPNRVFARVVPERYLNASLKANDEELSKDRRAVADKLRKLKEYPCRDVRRSVWCTWADGELSCESIFLIYDFRIKNPNSLFSSEAGPPITTEEIIACLALPEKYLGQTLYILYYQLPASVTLHVPTVADAGFENIDFLPKVSSEQCGKTRAQPPCYEGVHANCSPSSLQSVEIVHPSKPRRLVS